MAKWERIGGVAVAVAAACMVAAGCGGAAKPQADVVASGASSVSVHASTAGTGAGTAGSGGVIGGVQVDVAGAVRHPGVYQLSTTARVHEAIAAAGGVTRAADTSTLNRAAKVVDGEQIVVPSRAPAASGGGGASGAAPGGKVSINMATAAALDALPGIGPVTAQNIIDDRTKNGPFASVDDLDRVSGIGPAMLAQLEPLVTT